MKCFYVRMRLPLALICVACASRVSTSRLSTPVISVQPLDRRVQPLTERARTRYSNEQLTLIVEDPREYVLTVLLPRDGTLDRRIHITTPGLPFSEGSIEIRVTRVDEPNGRDFFQDVFTYLSTETTESLFVDLPEDLAAGTYSVQTRLVLYGSVSGVEPGVVTRERRQTFVRGSVRPSEPHPEQPQPVQVRSYVLILAGYDVNTTLMNETQKAEMAARLQDLRTAEVLSIRVRGHTCDLGTRDINYVVSMGRARTAITELRHLGLIPATLEPIPEAVWADESVSTNPDVNLRRFENRRVEIIVRYRPHANSGQGSPMP